MNMPECSCASPVPHSTLHSTQHPSLHTAPFTPHSTPHSTQPFTPHSTPHSTQHPSLHTAPFTPHSTPHSTQHPSLHTAPLTPHSTPHSTQHPSLHTALHSTQHLSHHTAPFTPHSTPHSTQHPSHYTALHSTQHPSLHTAPLTLHSTLHSTHCTYKAVTQPHPSLQHSPSVNSLESSHDATGAEPVATERLHWFSLCQQTYGTLEAFIQGRLELGIVAFHHLTARVGEGVAILSNNKLLRREWERDSKVLPCRSYRARERGGNRTKEVSSYSVVGCGLVVMNAWRK